MTLNTELALSTAGILSRSLNELRQTLVPSAFLFICSHSEIPPMKFGGTCFWRRYRELVHKPFKYGCEHKPNTCLQRSATQRQWQPLLREDTTEVRGQGERRDVDHLHPAPVRVSCGLQLSSLLTLYF